MSQEKRKKRFVDPVVQGALARRLVKHWCMFLAASALCTLLVHFLANPFRTPSEYVAQLWQMLGPALWVGLCLMPVFVYDTIKLSHRFAGPLMRIRGSMRRVGAGERVEFVKLRPDDYWQEFAQEFNSVLKRIHEYEDREQPQVASSTEPRGEPEHVSCT